MFKKWFYKITLLIGSDVCFRGIKYVLLVRKRCVFLIDFVERFMCIGGQLFDKRGEREQDIEKSRECGFGLALQIFEKIRRFLG